VALEEKLKIKVTSNSQQQTDPSLASFVAPPKLLKPNKKVPAGFKSLFKAIDTTS